MILKTPYKKAVLTIVLGMLTALPLSAQDQESRRKKPSSSVVPMEIIDNVKSTSRGAKDLESRIQETLPALENLMNQYYDKRCEGAYEDEGCQRVVQDLAKTYRRMLENMDAELPRLRNNMNVTQTVLERRLALELGLKKTAHDLQELLRAQQISNKPLSSQLPSRRTPLSDRFRQYYRLISMGSEGSTELIAAQMYLDINETQNLIDLIEQELQRGIILTHLTETWGSITPEMETIITNVKETLFGKGAVDEREKRVPDASEADDVFCSEFDPSC